MLFFIFKSCKSMQIIKFKLEYVKNGHTYCPSKTYKKSDKIVIFTQNFILKVIFSI